MSKANEPGAGAKKPSRAASTKPVYQRGDYRLFEVPGRNYQIRIYNPLTKVTDRESARTNDLEKAKKALDKLYHGNDFCPHCGQAVEKNEADGDNVVRIIENYAVAHGEDQISKGSLLVRLNHVKRYIGDKPVRVGHCNDTWAKEFRKWMLAEPRYVGKGPTRRAKYRKASTVEGSLLQLAAAIRFAKKEPQFTVEQPAKLSEPVDLRADIPLLAAMFRHALQREPSVDPSKPGRHRRVNLLYFLRLSVATWGRPEAVMEADLTPSAKQWVSDARVFRLNPAHRKQNNKHRPVVPVPEVIGQWLDSLPKKPVLPAGLAPSTWRRMMAELKPDAPEGEAGMKLIRRSMATLGRRRLGEANWRQGEMMGGWVKTSTADVYAVADPANLGLVLSVTAGIIDEIEALVPGAFIDANHELITQPTNVIAMAG